MSQLSAVANSTRSATLRLLILTPAHHHTPVLDELLERQDIEPIHVHTAREARDPELLVNVDAVVLCDPDGELISNFNSGDAHLLADALLNHRLKCIVLSPGVSGGAPSLDDAFVSVPDHVTADELWGRAAMVQNYGPQLQRLDDQVASMQRLGKKLNRHFVEVDQELRLATRLQRDFLPKTLPEVGDIRFAALFRPANWVSGDVYDVRRLDETHLAFYLADAVGHGVAAGLLTMFIKQSVVGKRVDEESYVIVPPSDVLARLNCELADQHLPNSQFVTACYATIDTGTYEIVFARAGHPHPIHVKANGSCSEVRTAGGLLGVFPEETFDEISLILEPGEKLIIYSDGLEDELIASRDHEQGSVQWTSKLLDAVRQPASDCLAAISGRLDQAEGSLEPLDDMTAVIVERLPS